MEAQGGPVDFRNQPPPLQPLALAVSGINGSLHAQTHLQLAQDVLYMALHGGFGSAKGAGDFTQHL